MFDEHVEFFEGTLVEKDLEPLTGGELSATVLRVDAGLAAAKPGDFAAAFQFLQDFLHDPPIPPLA
jgi:hypothetical protein